MGRLFDTERMRKNALPTRATSDGGLRLAHPYPAALSTNVFMNLCLDTVSHDLALSHKLR
jgi:hypothetical protein